MNISSCLIVEAYSRWVGELVDEGWEATLLSFMFEQIPGSPARRWNIMSAEIERVYCTLLTRVVRNPRSPYHAWRRPVWIGSSDFPIHKNLKLTTSMISPNDGQHAHVVALMPSLSRLRKPLFMHLHEEQPRYTRSPLFYIDAQPVDSRPAFVADYALKAIKSGRVAADDLILLPRSLSELPGYRSLAYRRSQQ